MASASTKRRSNRQMASRKRSRYAEPETDDDLQSPSEDSDLDLPRELAPSPPRQQKRRKVQHKPKTRSKSAAIMTRPAPKRRKRAKVLEIGQPRRARQSIKQKDKAGLFFATSDGVVPPWTSLPQDILRDVFWFASQPATAAGSAWLISAARTCKAFMEPALEALYYWPQLWKPNALWQLSDIMDERSGRLMNYNTKVRRLDIDIVRLAYTTPAKGHFKLQDLVSKLPRLHHLELVHPQDEPPYRAISISQWLYPPQLFSALDAGGIRLTSWRWTKEMIPSRQQRPYDFMTEMHRTKAFETVRELILCGFHPIREAQLPTPDADGETSEPTLHSCIKMLPNLKDISMVSCEEVEKDWLLGLPTDLARLELSNCQFIYPEGLVNFLANSGAQLKELVLNHNPAIDLSFLPSLKQNCPRLEVLEMDLHFYSQYFNTSQMDPEYDELLAADEIPAWPSTIRQIDLVHMQKWTATGARNLFESLTDNAEELRDLRYIVLHSHIDVPWRDRAKFRDDWIDKLQQVFKRRNKPPFPHNGSKLQYKLWKERRTPKTVASPDEQDSASPASVAAPVAESSTRRSKRVADASEALQLRLLSLEPTTPVDASDDLESEVDLGGSGLMIHGLCDVVDLRIDNQRPRENQFSEQDFLDSERSGDDDWGEHNSPAEAEGYAW